ncbi:hypothetical protein AKJ65_01565 [candidate division MSBL1 archaeon SCGC-AAA259E19]|uniref:Uncharacterized protein n=1 Tax=candidate division MSBL1 archaeon SCGC-AAA259E19 TaxID=1698264 RepID=A0A133UN68_9EURY|nr:hypothetical protein AKJ65_01565 [candidate division MSBL1 archaeon SCGC-AAA259E19]
MKEKCLIGKMGRGRGDFGKWEARARAFLVTMGENEKRKGKRKWKSAEVQKKIKTKSRYIGESTVSKHLNYLVKKDLLKKEEKEPERGIKGPKLFLVNIPNSKQGEEEVLDTFLDKFGNDFKEQGIEGLKFKLFSELEDPMSFLFLIINPLLAPFDASLIRRDMAKNGIKQFVSNGVLPLPQLPSFRQMGKSISKLFGLNESRESIKKYRNELNEEDIDFLISNKETISKIINKWLEQVMSDSEIKEITNELENG